MAVGQRTRYGKILADWQVPEYVKYEHSRTWYVVVGGIGIAMLIQALVTLNLLFAVILLITAGIIFLHERRHPELVDFMIVETGIILGERYYAFKEITSFWIVYNPPEAKWLYFGVNRTMRKEIPIHLEEQNPVEIRRLLLNYLEEDIEKEEEATEEALGRIFKI